MNTTDHFTYTTPMTSDCLVKLLKSGLFENDADFYTWVHSFAPEQAKNKDHSIPEKNEPTTLGEWAELFVGDGELLDDPIPEEILQQLSETLTLTS